MELVQVHLKTENSETEKEAKISYKVFYSFFAYLYAVYWMAMYILAKVLLFFAWFLVKFFPLKRGQYSVGLGGLGR